MTSASHNPTVSDTAMETSIPTRLAIIPPPQSW
jgi:hypothetical protein